MIDKILDAVHSFVATSVVNFVFAAICALVFVLVGFKLSGFFAKLIKRGHIFSKMNESVRGFLAAFIGVSLKIVVVVFAASIVGFDVTALSAVLGTVGVTVGLALQGSLSNLMGGIMILMFEPFGVGDYIDNHTDSGTVLEIGIFYTKLETPDKKHITIPNGALSNATVVNYSTSDERRVDIDVQVDYKADPDKVIAILTKLGSLSDKIYTEPAPFAALVSQTGAVLTFTLRVWCKSEDYWDVYFYLRTMTKKALDAAGIEYPLQHFDVNLAQK